MRKLVALFFLSVAIIPSQGTVSSANASDPTSVGSIGIRISQIPADVLNHPYSKAYIVSRVYPGVPLTQRLEVFNTSSQKFEVSIYPGKATFSRGKFEVANGRTGNELTKWTKLSPGVVNLKPGESKFVNVTILPPDDAPSIQQFGVIWAEVHGAPNPSGITSVSRVGIRMYVPVGDSAAIAIGETNQTSNTNEIIVKKSLLSSFTKEVIIILILFALVFLLLFLFFFRRGNSDRKFIRENEKRLETQWKRERDRRRKIWKNRGRLNYSRHVQEEPPHDYEER